MAQNYRVSLISVFGDQAMLLLQVQSTCQVPQAASPTSVQTQHEQAQTRKMPDCCNCNSSGSYIYIYYSILIKQLTSHFFRTGDNALWEHGRLPSRTESFLTMLNVQCEVWVTAQNIWWPNRTHTHTFRSPSDRAQHTTAFPWHITSYTKSLTRPGRKHSGFFPPLKKTEYEELSSLSVLTPDGEGKLSRRMC